jgi:elongation factor Ts
MQVTTEQVKELRDATGVSVMQCRKALIEAGGDIEKAKIILRKISKDAADKKSDRTLGAGTVATYVHGGGLIGAMVELLCETDFVSKNEEFIATARDLAMHVAAFSPEYLSAALVPEEAKVKVRELFEEELKDKPAEIKEKALEAKVAAYFGEKALLEQPFVKNPDITVKTVVDQLVQKFGEKTEVGRFARFAVK